MKKLKKKGKGLNSKAMHCPYCKQKMTLRTAAGIYKGDAKDSMLYVCDGYPACDTYIRVHPGTTVPMGIPANGKLRALRNETHKHFDKIHKLGIMSRKDAYVWLADKLNLPMSHAHIGYFSEYHCKLIIEESDKLVAYFEKIRLNRRRLEEGGENNARAS